VTVALTAVASATALATQSFAEVGRSPQSVAADPATDMVYAANSYSFFTSQGSVSVIDGRPNADGAPPKVVATIPVGHYPTGIAVDPSTDMVYVSNYGSNSVSVIDGHTNRVTGTIGVGAHPADIGVVPSSDTIYVADAGNGKSRGTVSVIDGHTDRVVGSVGVGYEPFSIGVNTLSGTVYVGNQGGNGPSTGYLGTVSIIHGTNVIGTVGVDGTPTVIGVDDLTNTAYVANSGDYGDEVAVINNSGRLVSQISNPGGQGHGVAVNEDTHAVFVANMNSGQVGGPVGSLTVINAKTNGVIALVSAGGNPYGDAVDPTTNQVYIAQNTSPGIVSMLNFSGYSIIGGTPPATIPTTTTTSLSSLNGTLCGVMLKSGALKTLGINTYSITENHSIVVPGYGTCDIQSIPPSYPKDDTTPVGDVQLSVSHSYSPPPAGTDMKSLSGLGAGAELYGADSELPSVVFHRGKAAVILQFGFDIEALAALITAILPKLVTAAHQVYALMG
jgi:YVTN family beta-propeller protein